MNRIIKLQQPRHGTITILAAIMSIVLVGMVAFCVDLGYVLSAKEELQRSTDSAALAACWEFGQKLSKGNTTTAAGDYARVTAAQYATLNRVTGNPMTIDANTSNDPNGDVVFGYVADFKDSQSPFQTSNPARFNAVKVRLRKCPSANGEVPYFFARVFGLEGQSLSTEAVAGLIRDVKGFKAPSDGGTLGILPYALDLQTWTSFVANSGADNYKWNPTTKAITAGSDGLVEVNLFPQGTGSPGNRGTVDIGSSNNSTADITRQILHGISPKDLAYHGGSLEFNDEGELDLNGDTGISAGAKDELTSIKGQPRLIPIFSKVVGPGNNAQYTIIHWAGIRIMEVKLTGAMNQKRVTIQPCPMVVSGVIPSGESTSSFVYTPVVLVK